MAKLETRQTKLIDEIHALLDNDLFIAGYLEIPSASTPAFSFKATDPKNKFKLKEKPYIPTAYAGFIGKVAPTDKLHDSSGSIIITFGLAMIENYKDHYKKMEQLVVDTSGKFSSFELDGTTYKYALSSTPLTTGTQPVILNGDRITFVTLTVHYKLISKGYLGNETKISIYPNGLPLEIQELIITGGTLSSGDILNSTQKIASKEVTNIPANRSYLASLTFYEIDGILSDVLEERIAGITPQHKDFIFVKTHKGKITRQVVLIENVNKPIDVGTKDLYSATFRTSDEEEIIATQTQIEAVARIMKI